MHWHHLQWAFFWGRLCYNSLYTSSNYGSMGWSGKKYKDDVVISQALDRILTTTMLFVVSSGYCMTSTSGSKTTTDAIFHRTGRFALLSSSSFTGSNFWKWKKHGSFINLVEQATKRAFAETGLSKKTIMEIKPEVKTLQTFSETAREANVQEDTSFEEDLQPSTSA